MTTNKLADRVASLLVEFVPKQSKRELLSEAINDLLLAAQDVERKARGTKRMKTKLRAVA